MLVFPISHELLSKISRNLCGPQVQVARGKGRGHTSVTRVGSQDRTAVTGTWMDDEQEKVNTRV